MGARENKFQSSEGLCKHRKKFHPQFYFTNSFKCFIRSLTYVFDVCCHQRLFVLRRYRRLQYRM